MKPLIVLEFNEICPPLLDKWMSQGYLPNFKRFYDASDVFITKPDVDNAAEMEPWIQWYSIHTGLPYSQHGVFHLTDGPKAEFEDIWHILSKAGIRTGNMSGMNSRISHQSGNFGLPDPWCTSEKAFPSDMQPFQDFVQSQVQEYSNRKGVPKAGDIARLGAFFLKHGLSYKTVMGLVRQIASEKTTGGKVAWKRATQLDWMLLDVFRHYHRCFKPQYATFFLNSTAHYQHAYWRCMDPSAFQHPPTASEVEKYTDAILFGYQNMDRLLDEMFKIEASTGATLVMQSAISQQPFLRFEDIGGQNFYRPMDFAIFLKSIEIAPVQIQPVMTHQYMLRFANEKNAGDAAKLLQQFTLDGDTVFDIRTEGSSLYIGCVIVRAIPQDAVMTVGRDSVVPFFDVFYRIEDTKSGCHHPDGVLWVKGGTHCVHDDKVSILDWFPTVTEYFGVDNPASGLLGESILSRLGLPQSKAA